MVSSLEKAEEHVLHLHEQWLDEWAERDANHNTYNEIKHESLEKGGYDLSGWDKNTTETAMARISKLWCEP